MKKSILSILLAAACFSLYAQKPQCPEENEAKLTPEQRAQFKAERLASEILLSDEATAQFVPVYKAYILEVKAINEKYCPAGCRKGVKGKPLSDSEVKAMIEANFAKSQAILDARKAYYQKYLKILTPKQIMMVYSSEKKGVERAAYNHYGKCHDMHQKPGERPQHCR